MSKDKKQSSCRLGKVGGQAVLEGVMMKAGERTVTTCRKEDKSLVVYDDNFVSVRKKNKILNLPIIRGVVNFIEMMILSVKTLDASADALELEEDEGKAEKWMKKHLGISLTDFVMVLGVVLGIALSLFLFMFLPTLAAEGVNYLYKILFGKSAGIGAVAISIIEGVLKVAIFIAYLALVSLMPDIKRTFMYHGAEHKSIACFEAGDELTPENAKKHTRFHPRCGTSFMFLMIALGILAGLSVRLFIPGLTKLAYVGIRLLILPLVMGIGYELLMIMGKHDNAVTRIMAAPGLWVQRLTTKEPTDDMLEVAIVSIKCALRDEFDEFGEYFKERPWEKDGGSTVIGEVRRAEKKAEIEAAKLEAKKKAAPKNESEKAAKPEAAIESTEAQAMEAKPEAAIESTEAQATEATSKAATEADLTPEATTEAVTVPEVKEAAEATATEEEEITDAATANEDSDATPTESNGESAAENTEDSEGATE